MKISELITRLEGFKEAYGDIQVAIIHPAFKDGKPCLGKTGNIHVKPRTDITNGADVVTGLEPGVGIELTSLPF